MPAPEHSYEVVLYWSDADNAVLAEVPDLPGCMADGRPTPRPPRTPEVVIWEWVETARELGRRVPRPTRRPAAV